MKQNRIEDDINELYDYIDNCKTTLLSQGKIICDKEELEEIIDKLRRDIPKEIEYARDVMARSEAIETEAKERASKIVNDATEKTNELLSENEINQQAIRRADSIVQAAAEQGQEIYDNYVREGNEYRDSAQRYLNDMLVNLSEIIANCVDVTTRNTNKLLDSLNKVGQTVNDNLNELNGANEPAPVNNNRPINGVGGLSEISND